MQKKLLILSFIEGAVVMVAEICGAKLLAPIFGSSLYVWASVMGITLAALAVGYFYGGAISDKTKEPQKKLANILFLAALFVLLMPILAHYAIPYISYLPFLIGVVYSTIVLLFLPVFFLGASSPLFILIQTNKEISAGKASGTVYAISTAGGIFATFLCGFYLIPAIGLNACLIAFGIILFVGTIVVFKFRKTAEIGLFLIIVFVNLQFTFKKSNIEYDAESLLGHLEVKTITKENIENVRILSINNIVQSEMDLNTHKSISQYIKLLDTLTTNYDKNKVNRINKKALLLGLGGGLTANFLVNKNYSVDGVEFDERIIFAAKKYFFLNKKVNAICSDARYFLNNCTKKYDLVLVDIYKAEEQPSHVLTTESLTKLKQNLNDNALLLINWHGYMGNEIGIGITILYNTLKNVGFDVLLNSWTKQQDNRNIILTATLKPIEPSLKYNINETLSNTNLINSDNFPLLEKYNALASKAWRTNYLRYYQSLNLE